MISFRQLLGPYLVLRAESGESWIETIDGHVIPESIKPVDPADPYQSILAAVERAFKDGLTGVPGPQWQALSTAGPLMFNWVRMAGPKSIVIYPVRGKGLHYEVSIRRADYPDDSPEARLVRAYFPTCTKAVQAVDAVFPRGAK